MTAPGERYLFPLRRRQSHADESIVVAAACANRPSKEASSGSPVAVFPRQTICLTGVFTNPKVDTPDLAGDGLWHVLELDAPDALIRRKVSVDMGENRIGSGLIRDPTRR